MLQLLLITNKKTMYLYIYNYTLLILNTMAEMYIQERHDRSKLYMA